MIAASEHLGSEVAIAELDAAADLYFLAGAHESFPRLGVETAGQQDLNLSVARRRELCPGFGWSLRAASQQASGNDSGIVHDQQLISAKKGREVREHAVFVGWGGTIEKKHARSIAGRERALSDLVGRELIVEIRWKHGRQFNRV
jgi:hypothetical protein